MAATYPSSLVTFVNKRDSTDAVIASDVNLAYAEISAIETALGTLPSQPSWSGSFDQITSDFNTVNARLANIEAGLNVAYNSRVKISGGSTVASTGAVVGVTFQTSGTGNLATFNNTSGAAVTSVTKDGWIDVLDGGSAV